MNNSASWSDLAPRLLSALVMAAIGIGAVWAGGVVFSALLWLLAGLMIWELARMLQPDPASFAVRQGALASCALFLCSVLPGAMVLPLIVAAALVGAGQINRDKGIYLAYAVGILLAGYALVILRQQAGLSWVLWLICVVIASDVAGYFAGRLLGGPKFWPRVSPKKTWSGTIAGWIGSGAVGLAFWGPLGAGAGLVVLSVLVGFAGQMGDIAESAIKRHVGIKDSSALIPGHGGVLDRFDAMLGAALIAAALWVTGVLPGGG